jgi:hypothetical protein
LSNRTLIIDVDCVICCEVANFASSSRPARRRVVQPIGSALDNSRTGEKFEVMAMKTSSILVVDDYADLREGLSEVLEEMLARFDPRPARAQMLHLSKTP